MNIDDEAVIRVFAKYSVDDLLKWRNNLTNERDNMHFMLSAYLAKKAEMDEIITNRKEEMSLAVALDFADNPRPYHQLKAPADTNSELYQALKVLAKAYREAVGTN